MAEGATVHSIDEITQALAAREADRPIYTYTIPKVLAQLTGVVTIGMVELTTQEMIMAQQRGGEQRLAVGFELAKAAWRRKNDERLSLGDGSVDLAWASNKPGMTKLRTLLTQAYADLHNPKEDENAAFLASQSVQIGG